MTEAEAYDGLRVWAAQNGMNAESVGGEGWKAATVRGSSSDQPHVKNLSTADRSGQLAFPAYR